MIKIELDCSIKTNFIKIYANQDNITVLDENLLKFKTFDLQLEHFDHTLINIKKLTNFIDNKNSLDKISTDVRYIEDLTKLNNLNKHDIHHYSLGYASIFIIIITIIILMIVYKIKRSKKKRVVVLENNDNTGTVVQPTTINPVYTIE